MKKVSVISRHPSHKQFDFPMFDKSVRIRFGSQSTFRAKKDIEFPSKETISNTSNKVKMKNLFQKGGVLSPIWMRVSINVLRHLINNPIELKYIIGYDKLFILKEGKVVPKFPLIFKELNHSRGEGILFVDSNYDIQALIENGKDGYVEQVIGNDREFRVHVCDGNAFYVDEKLPREEGHVARIKNLENGYKYRNRSISRPYPSIIKEESIRAVKSLGIDFGAVDIAIDKDGEVHVFEVNSAMGLRTKTRALYQEELIKLIIKKGAKIIG